MKINNVFEMEGEIVHVIFGCAISAAEYLRRFSKCEIAGILRYDMKFANIVENVYEFGGKLFLLEKKSGLSFGHEIGFRDGVWKIWDCEKIIWKCSKCHLLFLKEEEETQHHYHDDDNECQ